MEPFPHRYRVTGSGRVMGDVDLVSERLNTLRSASPAQFGGPGNRWSPETLLVGALADCFILTFRAIARASHLSWISLDCDAVGTLDRVDRVTQFTHFEMTARLAIARQEDAERAQHALEQTERSCLISSSLKGTIDLKARVEIGEPAQLEACAS